MCACIAGVVNRKASKDAAVEEIIKLLHFAERCNSSARFSSPLSLPLPSSSSLRGTRSRVSHVLEQTQRRAELDEPSVLSDRRLPSRKIAKSFIAEPKEEESFPEKVSRHHPRLLIRPSPTHPISRIFFLLPSQESSRASESCEYS